MKIGITDSFISVFNNINVQAEMYRKFEQFQDTVDIQLFYWLLWKSKIDSFIMPLHENRSEHEAIEKDSSR